MYVRQKKGLSDKCFLRRFSCSDSVLLDIPWYCPSDGMTRKNVGPNRFISKGARKKV